MWRVNELEKWNAIATRVPSRVSRTRERLKLLQGNGCLDGDERHQRENEAWDGNKKVLIDAENVRWWG